MNRSSQFKIAWTQALRGLQFRWKKHVLTLVAISSGVALLAAVRTFATTKGSTHPMLAERLEFYAFASLVLCLFGATQSLVISVTSQTKEIGTMKCLGASDQLAVLMIVLESGVVGIVSTLFGAGIGLVMGSILGGTPLMASMGNLAPVLLIGTVLTLIAILPPAIIAAKLEAVQAMRVEG